MTTPHGPVPPGRSLIFAEPASPEEGGGIVFGCDCAHTTQVIIEGTPQDGQETAFVCEGCESVHWLTFRAQEATPAVRAQADEGPFTPMYKGDPRGGDL